MNRNRILPALCIATIGVAALLLWAVSTLRERNNAQFFTLHTIDKDAWLNGDMGFTFWNYVLVVTGLVACGVLLKQSSKQMCGPLRRNSSNADIGSQK